MLLLHGTVGCFFSTHDIIKLSIRDQKKHYFMHLLINYYFSLGDHEPTNIDKFLGCENIFTTACFRG